MKRKQYRFWYVLAYTQHWMSPFLLEVLYIRLEFNCIYNNIIELNNWFERNFVVNLTYLFMLIECNCSFADAATFPTEGLFLFGKSCASDIFLSCKRNQFETYAWPTRDLKCFQPKYDIHIKTRSKLKSREIIIHLILAEMAI